MGDPSKFANIIEYNVLMYVLGALLLSECIIWFLTLKGSRDSSKKHSDNGTFWLIIIGWCCSVMSGAFFRSQSMPQAVRNWLLPHFTYYIGIVCIVAGIIVRCTAVGTLKHAFTLSVQTTDSQHLIQTGLYGIVRNPAYTGSIISLLGVACAYGHILGIIGVFVICLICYGVRIHVEEKALTTQFQEEFEQYCKHTKYRLIPGVY
ncbi:isoprenylcysteine carboxyl methyltransferase (ICMT) family protein [Ruminiclostridium hungatei]|uniref:Isoprenylcysteine carboxyl methyltransferase (ICMT) family protein n=1 Tax=Ruminiclostridium hungatei TaxID=48256 RepID=A0A1V4SHY7_RUMHU|nr:isoprenylcysteine carboxyl methyltransferase (ICMT) family protein [Ruminiclostridium hungatei]